MLIVRDEKTGEISVVAGLKSDGTPKTTAATEANKDLLAPLRVDTQKFEKQEEQVQTVSEGIKPATNEHNESGDLDPFWQAVEDHWFPDEKESGQQENVHRVGKATVERPLLRH